MDLFEDAGPGGNAPEYTVSELSGAVKRVVEGEFGFVRVRAEVGRVTRHRSGHVYLDLKDDRACLSGVIWRTAAGRLETMPEEGMEVVAKGRLTTYPGQSKYQMVIEEIAPAGLGALMAMLEKRRAALAAEGLFAAERKRALPYLPEVIGVVTSPTGAVIRDILHRLRDRFPRRVLVWPVAVQGTNCAAEVARAIEGFNAMAPGGPIPRPELLIVARGGGSIEDLWGFNEEVVVRAAAASAIPLISAVGHETDTTLIDHAADRRAPTPTAAAEMAVPVRSELLARVAEAGARATRCAGQSVTRKRQRLTDLGRGLPRAESLIEGPRQRFDMAAEGLPRALRRSVADRGVALRERSSGLRPPMLSGLLRRAGETRAAAAARLDAAFNRRGRENAAAIEALARRLRPELASRVAAGAAAACATARTRLSRAAGADLAARRQRLEELERLRQTLGYQATLRRGYVVVRNGERLVTRSADASEARTLELEFADGRVDTVPARPDGRARRKGPAPAQGSLF